MIQVPDTLRGPFVAARGATLRDRLLGWAANTGERHWGAESADHRRPSNLIRFVPA